MTRIFVSTYAHYNNGSLKGQWLDLPCDDLDAELLKIFGEGDHEYMIQDHESEFPIKESENIQKLNEFAEEFEALSEHDQKIVAWLIKDQCYDRADALDKCDEVTFYEGQTLQDVAEQLVDDGCFGDIPKAIASYIDYDAIARDLSFDSYVETSDGVFHNP
jgi:antirestriction protein